MKLKEELYIKQVKRMNALISNSSPFAKYFTKPDFNKILKSQLNILSALEKKFPNVTIDGCSKSDKLVLEFNSYTKSDFQIDTNYKLEDDADYIDAINYLHMYCKNIFKVDLDDIIDGKKVNIKSPDINLGADARAEFNNQNGTSSIPFMAFAGGMDPMVYGQASKKVTDDIKNGKLYQYTSKPKIIPIIKYILVGLSGLLALSLILCAIFAFLTNGLLYKTDSGVKQVSFITNGIFYLITAGFCIYTLTNDCISIKKSKNNDNQKYRFTWPYYVCDIFLSLFICIWDLVAVWTQSGVVDTSYHFTVGFKGLKILLIIVMIFVGLIAVPTIIGAVKAPKANNKAIEDALRDYMSDLSGSNNTNKVEEQKPIGVVDKSKSKDSDDKAIIS